MTVKFTRELVKLGNKELYVYMMPDGSYRLNQTQVAELLGVSTRTIQRHISSSDATRNIQERLKAAGRKSLARDNTQEHVITARYGQKQLQLWTLDLATCYAMTVDTDESRALMAASFAEAITRRADEAFGIKKLLLVC